MNLKILPAAGHKIFPYLLRGLAIEWPNQVWCADITDIPLPRGFLYLVAIMDWASGAVLAWQLSNTMDTSFCVLALDETYHWFSPWGPLHPIGIAATAREHGTRGRHRANG